MAARLSRLVQRAWTGFRSFREDALQPDSVSTSRLRPGWLVVALTLGWLATAGDVSAQQYGPYPAAPPMGGYPGAAPAYSATPTQGLPPSFQSHPYISPFDHAMEEHFTSDGLWFKRSIPGSAQGAYANDYFFRLSYSRSRFREPDGLFGNPNAALDTFLVLPDDDPDIFPDALFYQTHDPVQAGIVPDVFAHGIQMQGGLRSNPTDFRFSWNAHYTPAQTGIYDARARKEALRFNPFDAILLTASDGIANGAIPPNLRHFDQLRLVEEVILGERFFDVTDSEVFGPFGTTFDLLDANLLVLPGITLQNSFDPLDPGARIGGFTQTFDIEFLLRREVETWGGGFHMTMGPIAEFHGVEIRPVMGGRYMRIHEGQFFNGTDSGLAYTRSVIQDGIDNDGDFFIDEVDEGGGQRNFTQLNPSRQILIRSFMDSIIRTDLAGPELGLEYSLGEQLGLDLTGTTRFGVMFNTTRKNLSGDNIGDTRTVTIDPITGLPILQDMFDTTTLDGPTQNAFSDERSSNHLSPMFEQSLHANLNLFSKVPVLREIRTLQHAQLQVGYTFTWLGAIADPNESIDFISNPRQGIFPTLNSSYSSFWQNSFDVGVNWEY